MADDDKTTTPQIPTFRRSKEICQRYANNVQFETTVWDMKIVFGEVDQFADPAVIEQHTTITLSWLEAKIMAYYLVVNLALYQAKHGSIPVPPLVLPLGPSKDSPDIPDKDLAKYMAWIHDQFFGATPYVPPDAAEEPTTPPAS